MLFVLVSQPCLKENKNGPKQLFIFSFFISFSTYFFPLK